MQDVLVNSSDRDPADWVHVPFRAAFDRDLTPALGAFLLLMVGFVLPPVAMAAGLLANRQLELLPRGRKFTADRSLARATRTLAVAMTAVWLLLGLAFAAA